MEACVATLCYTIFRQRSEAVRWQDRSVSRNCCRGGRAALRCLKRELLCLAKGRVVDEGSQYLPDLSWVTPRTSAFDVELETVRER